ncbi:MAG: hypothetical protein CM1200mP2_33130 [Planctomycetaceae bacterium]|nr:MAG: hypothetical protein CM1200mP2_33130 [Planctomycetaceae bacterium]
MRSRIVWPTDASVCANPPPTSQFTANVVQNRRESFHGHSLAKQFEHIDRCVTQSESSDHFFQFAAEWLTRVARRNLKRALERRPGLHGRNQHIDTVGQLRFDAIESHLQDPCIQLGQQECHDEAEGS